MKGILETSLYLIIFCIICFSSVELISLHINIVKMNELKEYVKNYVEVNGVNKNSATATDNEIDDDTMEDMYSLVSEKKASLTCEYFGKTDSNAYYRVCIAYPVKSSFFNFRKTGKSIGIVKVAF